MYGREIEERMFRAMRAAADGLPLVGRSARELGVRVEGNVVDLPVLADGSVHPNTGGMSVALDDARHLPKHRRPRPLGGEGRDPVFGLATTSLPGDLRVRHDPYPHALVEPAQPCLLEHYESALLGTRSSWTEAP